MGEISLLEWIQILQAVVVSIAIAFAIAHNNRH